MEIASWCSRLAERRPRSLVSSPDFDPTARRYSTIYVERVRLRINGRELEFTMRRSDVGRYTLRELINSGHRMGAYDPQATRSRMRDASPFGLHDGAVYCASAPKSSRPP